MSHQLRIYRVKPGHMEPFIDAWQTYAVPVRKKFGFAVVGAWSSEATNTFAWIVSHDGPEGFAAAAEAYYASAERAAMAVDPAIHLDEVTTIEPLEPLDALGIGQGDGARLSQTD